MLLLSRCSIMLFLTFALKNNRLLGWAYTTTILIWGIAHLAILKVLAIRT